MPHVTKRRLRQLRYDPSGLASPPRALNQAQKRFVEEYLMDPTNPAECASRAGYFSPQSAGLLLRLPSVQAAIGLAQRRRADRTEVGTDHVLRCWDLARRVDYNEFVEVRRRCCRYCWGEGHRYQFTADELRTARTKHLVAQLQIKDESRRREFDDLGGDGYDQMRLPCFDSERAEILGYNPELATADHTCPECNGIGTETPLVLIKDTRFLSYGARYIYQGVEIGANGSLKFNLRPRSNLDELVGRHLGMFPREAKRPRPVEELSDDELNDLLNANGVTVDVTNELDQLEGESGTNIPGDVDPGEEAPAGGEAQEAPPELS